jgi:hypothetical protein
LRSSYVFRYRFKSSPEQIGLCRDRIAIAVADPPDGNTRITARAPAKPAGKTERTDDGPFGRVIARHDHRIRTDGGAI